MQNSDLFNENWKDLTENLDNTENQNNENENISSEPIFQNKQEQIPVEIKIKNSLKLKEEGIKLFQDKIFSEALYKFKEGLELLYGEGLNKEASELMLSHNLNLCNCLNNLNAFDQTIERTEFSLKLRKDHPKIYYYRGMAYINLNKLEEAERDYERLKELIQPNDAGLTNLKNLIDQKMPKQNKNVFKSMLKANLYEDIKQVKSINNSDQNSDSEDENISNNIFNVYENK